MKIKAPSREENLEHLKKYFFERIKEENDDLLNYVIGASWGNGYNLVLDACWEVLPREDYWKIVNKLEEWENNKTE